MRRALLTSLVLALLLASPANAARVEPRIVGGTPVTAGDYPWQVALLTENGSGEMVQYCGGTLVRTQWVVTADHCAPAPSEEARVNSIDRTTGGQRIVIDQVIRHPQADGRGFGAPRYDVDLLHLAQPVTGARPLVIAGPADGALWSAGTALTITGWGDTASGSGAGSDTMLKATVERRADAACALAYGIDFSTADMFCAGTGQTDTCQGDSGGPIVAPTVASPSRRNPAHWRLVGVTSWGTGCADPQYPGIYARITEPVFQTWLAEQLPDEPPVDTGETATPDGGTDAAGTDVVADDPPAADTTPAVPVTTTVATPVATPRVVATPSVVRATRRCTRRRVCTFTITTSAATAVRATLRSTTTRSCRRGGRRTTCRTTTTRTPKARAAATAGRFLATTTRLPGGTHRLTLVATGEGGRSAAYTLRFTLR